jgi:hypothetical protein
MLDAVFGFPFPKVETRRVQLLDGRHGVNYGDTLWRGEAEGAGRDGGVGLFAGEGEAGNDAVGFLDFDAGDDAVGSDGEGEALDAFFLVVGDSGERKGAIGSR